MYTIAKLSVVAVLVGAVLLASTVFVRSQDPVSVSDKPLTEKWAPSEWGPNDKAGSVNRITPPVVLKAIESNGHRK